ncbi:hypothetical protein POM88_019887 [Heracleum sosnowskyi]|uniref:Uncharacterized protein n=1 Tax=Heracleum sosnowskyi TaxID=360622 RepID=A0AAD8ICS7_9APIA|nr:hypothetical protein POM88_019887 [Heracleum sosnowskyi]
MEIQGLEELTYLRELHLAGCNLSLLARTLTKPFFEILSEFGHEVNIYIGRKDFRDWICQDLGIQLEPDESHNFLAMILTFEDPHFGVTYSVKNITSGFIWIDILCNLTDNESLIVIVPSSILSIRDGDEIELKSDQKMICGIHLLYKKEIKMISTTDNVEDERSNPLHSDLEINSKWLSLGITSTTVNVGEERSYPSKR